MLMALLILLFIVVAVVVFALFVPDWQFCPICG